MMCLCGGRTKVIETRTFESPKTINVERGTVYRRRECPKCLKRFTTIERKV